MGTRPRFSRVWRAYSTALEALPQRRTLGSSVLIDIGPGVNSDEHPQRQRVPSEHGTCADTLRRMTVPVGHHEGHPVVERDSVLQGDKHFVEVGLAPVGHRPM